MWRGTGCDPVPAGHKIDVQREATLVQVHDIAFQVCGGVLLLRGLSGVSLETLCCNAMHRRYAGWPEDRFPYRRGNGADRLGDGADRPGDGAVETRFGFQGCGLSALSKIPG